MICTLPSKTNEFDILSLENPPKVAIIILNWNSFNTTKDCLISLDKISYPNYRIIIVDNHSADGSPELFRNRFPQHHLIVNAENLGFPGGNNVGIKWALKNDFQYILLLNYDTIANPDFLDKLIEVAEKRPSIGILGPCIKFYSKPEKAWSYGGYIDSKTGRPFHLNKMSEIGHKILVEVEWVSGCGLLIKSDVVRNIGLLDQEYFFGIEDADWCLRAIKAGYKVVFVPESTIYHKTSITRFKEKYTHVHHYYNMRNLLIFIEKHGSFNFLFLISFLFSLLKRATWSLIKLDIKSIRALWLAVRDFSNKKYGKATFIF